MNHVESNRKTSYLRVREVLDAVRRFHGQLAGFYAKLTTLAKRERTRMLLGYMVSHERVMEEALRNCDTQTERKYLDTWMQYTPDRDRLSVPVADTFDPQITVEEMVTVMQDLDNRIIDFYTESIQWVDIPELRELFDRLREQERTENIEVAKQAALLEREM